MREPRVRRAVADNESPQRGASASWALACVLVLVVCACRRDDAGARLITLSGVEVDEDTRALTLLGEGFAVGSACTLTLDGTAYPPRRHPERMDVEVPCHALTSERAGASLEQPALTAHGSAAFEGRLELSFTAQGGGRVSGALEHVRLRLFAHDPTRVDEELALRHAALEFQRRIGIGSVEVTSRGLTLVSVDEQGAAALSGLRAGDVVQRINGAPVQEAFDLVPTSDASVARIEAQRRATAGSVVAVLPLYEREPTDGTLLGLLLALGVITGLLWPGVRTVAINAGGARTLAQSYALGGVVVMSSALTTERFDARWPWMVLLVTAGISLWLAHARARMSTLELTREAAALASATACIAALALVLGSTSDDVTATTLGRVWPWQWPALASPAGLLAIFGLFAACPLPSAASGAPRMVRGLHIGLTAWLIAGLGLGSGHLPPSLELGPIALRCASWLSLASKALVISLLLGFVARRGRAHSVRAWLAAACAPVAALCAPLAFDGAATQPSLGALASGLGLGLVLSAAFRAVLRRREPARDPALAPFL